MFNFPILIASSCASLLIGFVWYNPNVFGAVWMRETGIVYDEAKKQT